MTYESINSGEFDDNSGGDSASAGAPWRLIGLGVAVAVIVIFIVQNLDTIPVQFLGIEINIRLWLLIVISVALGMLIDRMISWLMRRRNRE